MMSVLTISMVAYDALVVMRRGLGAARAELVKESEVADKVAEVVIELDNDEFMGSLDSFSDRHLKPAIEVMLKEVRRPGWNLVFVRQVVGTSGGGRVEVCATDEDMGVALNVVTRRMADGKIMVRISCRYGWVPRPPYTVTYKLQPADPLDWSPEERGLQRVIEEDLAAGVAVLARPVSPLKEGV